MVVRLNDTDENRARTYVPAYGEVIVHDTV
jgi:hypothetical protein